MFQNDVKYEKDLCEIQSRTTIDKQQTVFSYMLIKTQMMVYIRCLIDLCKCNTCSL